MFKGYDKMENGAYMQFHDVNDNGEMPKIGDHVIVSVKQSMGDSLFYSSEYEEGGTIEFELTMSSFVGDMMAGLLNMHLNDSATVAFLIDSMCIKTLGMDAVPDYLTAGMPIYIDMRLKGIITAEEVAAQQDFELQMMKQNDEDRLAMYYSDEKNKITKSGLIILSVKGKGRGAKVGEILMINFNLLDLDGDTLLDLFDREPVAVRCGDLELGEGFAEAMKYVPEGGEGQFVIPSALAFDSIGLENSIMPYTSLVLNVRNTSILTQEEYEAEQKKKYEAEEAENQKRLEEEPARIEKFIKEHNVNVAPSASGVYYLEIETGDGPVVDNGDIVTIHYNLYNIEDKLIESSFGSDPLQFVYGNNEMVPGIEEALGNMRVGGKATLIIPSTMGFGDVAIDKELPANSTVIFDIELIDVQKPR
ncbi:MAG: FKBP-type peptidyl-prolyl cis-trans isomerase [Bacteroidales bacterium]|nr:FKBP-type peptidyl-prolyl cis-trans isomerase [Bacteroidales bacterium]